MSEAQLRDRIEYLEAENASLRDLMRIDPSTAFIRQAKDSLRVMPQVAHLLWVLWDCKPKTREQIYHAIWGHLLSPPEIKTIDVQMCRLRAAVAYFDAKIGTVWGSGFHLSHEDRAKIAAATGIEANP